MLRRIRFILRDREKIKLPLTKKSLGQHWLTDEAALETIVQSAAIRPDATVLEIGPGPGTLTAKLVKRAGQVIAVEFDEALARQLPSKVSANNLTVVHSDILKFDFSTLPPDYTVVANIPYYLTSNLVRILSESANPPAAAVLLVQKEVAIRLAAAPGNMSLLSVTAQYFWEVSLGPEVAARLFMPAPKVNSQVVTLQYRAKPLFPDVQPKQFFQLVKAGFSERRKKLRSSLSGGLHMEKSAVTELLQSAGIDPDLRAQALNLEQWHKLYLQIVNHSRSVI